MIFQWNFVAALVLKVYLRKIVESADANWSGVQCGLFLSVRKWWNDIIFLHSFGYVLTTCINLYIWINTGNYKSNLDVRFFSIHCAAISYSVSCPFYTIGRVFRHDVLFFTKTWSIHSIHGLIINWYLLLKFTNLLQHINHQIFI